MLHIKNLHRNCKVVISKYLVLALIPCQINHFPCMHVSLFERDECERSMKNQVSKDESVEFATCSREATHEKATCRAHDWKLKSHARLWISQVFCEKGQPAKHPRNCLFGKKLCCFTKSFTHTIYTLITHEL